MAMYGRTSWSINIDGNPKNCESFFEGSSLKVRIDREDNVKPGETRSDGIGNKFSLLSDDVLLFSESRLNNAPYFTGSRRKSCLQALRAISKLSPSSKSYRQALGGPPQRATTDQKRGKSCEVKNVDKEESLKSSPTGEKTVIRSSRDSEKMVVGELTNDDKATKTSVTLAKRALADSATNRAQQSGNGSSPIGGLITNGVRDLDSDVRRNNHAAFIEPSNSRKLHAEENSKYLMWKPKSVSIIKPSKRVTFPPKQEKLENFQPHVPDYSYPVYREFRSGLRIRCHKKVPKNDPTFFGSVLLAVLTELQAVKEYFGGNVWSLTFWVNLASMPLVAVLAFVLQMLSVTLYTVGGVVVGLMLLLGFTASLLTSMLVRGLRVPWAQEWFCAAYLTITSSVRNHWKGLIYYEGKDEFRTIFKSSQTT